MKTIFGEFWDIEQQTNSDLWEHCDTAYTNVALKAHTDCTYMYNTPLYVVVVPSTSSVSPPFPPRSGIWKNCKLQHNERE